jgi:hypothetical protein
MEQCREVTEQVPMAVEAKLSVREGERATAFIREGELERRFANTSR